jgi:hypothetical protein
VKTLPTLLELQGLGLPDPARVLFALDEHRTEWDQLAGYRCGLPYDDKAATRVELAREFAARRLPWLTAAQGATLAGWLVAQDLA